MLKRQRQLYPRNWEKIAAAVKASAGWQCENCGRTCRRPNESLHEFAQRLVGTDQPLRLANDLSEYPLALMEVLLWPGCWTLTTSHKDQNPANCEPGNLRALCAPCHLTYDNGRPQRALREHLKAERAGQLPLF